MVVCKVLCCYQQSFLLQFIFDLQPGDIFGCLADLGWVAGHASVVYGPLCNGVTAVLFESVATYPNCGMYITILQPCLKFILLRICQSLHMFEVSVPLPTFRKILGDD